MRRKIIEWVVVIIFLTCSFEIAFSEVQTRIIADVYVLPVAELVGTKTYPEIIEIENDLIKIQLIPNRGRVLADFIAKRNNVSFLYKNLKPDPMILPSGLHGVEFGGYYFSLPWNTRDRQPYDLQFEVTKSTSDESEVYISGTDMFQRTLTECWVRVRDNISVVEIETRITNTSKRKTKEIGFQDFAFVSAVGPRSGQAEFMLPADSIEIVKSEDDWLGSQGKIIAWPTDIKSWSNIEKFFHIRTASVLTWPCYAVRYPSLRAAFVKFWEPVNFFRHVEVWTWGEGYKQRKGIGAYFGISSVNEKITLQPKESIVFTVYFAVLDDFGDGESLEELYEHAVSYIKEWGYAIDSGNE